MKKKDKIYLQYYPDIIHVEGKKLGQLKCRKCKGLITCRKIILENHIKKCNINIQTERICDNKTVILNQLMILISKNSLSLSIIDNIYFRNFIYLLNPNVKLVSRRTITDNLIKYSSDILKKKLETIKNNFFSIIIDSSTNIKGSRIVNIIISIKNMDIFIKSIEANHQTTENLAEIIITNLNGLYMNNLVSIICDNAPSYLNIHNKINNIYNTKVVNMTCICHSINLVIEKFSKLQIYKNYIQIILDLSMKLRKCEVHRELINISTEFHMNYLRCKAISNTRWSYNLQIFQRIKDNQMVIEKYCSLHPYSEISMIISNDLFDDLNTYIEIYEILNKYIKIFEKKVSIFTTFDCIINLYDELSDKEIVLNTCKEVFSRHVNFNLLSVASFLNPSSKLSDEYLLKGKLNILKYCSNSIDEIVRYLNLMNDEMNKNMSVDQFWSIYKEHLPILFSIVKKIETIQPSSCSVERSFSVQSLFHTSIRNSLSLKVINSMMIIKSIC